MQPSVNFEDETWEITYSKSDKTSGTLSHKGLSAYVEFKIKQGQVIDFQHVFVPESARGKGAGAVVMDKAFEMALAYGCVGVIPTCTYVSQTYLPKREKAGGRALEVPVV